jgi:dihydrofolate synthase / folylpolyglutamate synthase
MKIYSLQEAEKILQTYIPQVSSYSGDNLTLDRMFPLLEKLGNPHNRLKIIHVAGTSGKTSTSYYIAALLYKSGKKVGLTVSPHVDSITERIQINGVSISDEKFCSELGFFIDKISDLEVNPSYFELLIAFIYWYFDKEKVDYAVVETGMGGLLDGTNVATRSDKVCAITDIGFDHMHILGKSLAEISRQKAGIIHQKNEVFMYKQSEEIMAQIRSRISEKNAKLNKFSYDILHRNSNIASALPEFQKRNWLLAMQVVIYVSKRDRFPLATTVPSSVNVPARMEEILLHDGGNKLIMDGAHNKQKMSMFVDSFKSKYPNKKAVIMLSLKKGKEFKEVVDALIPITNKLILTTFITSQDLPAVAQDNLIIADYCKKNGVSFEIINNNKVAIKVLLETNYEIKIITGSFYLLGQVRKYLNDILQ